MRYSLILALLVAGCTLGGGKLESPSAASNPVTGDAISVTALDGAPVAQPGAKPAPPVGNPANPALSAAADAAKVAPSKPATANPPQANPTAPAVAEPPPKPIPPEALACLKKSGEWSVVGDGGAMACIHRTRDAGKTCHRKKECQGECLAKSNSCSPITPLFGCNDILQNDGTMVTQCID